MHVFFLIFQVENTKLYSFVPVKQLQRTVNPAILQKACVIHLYSILS